mmetsp:Transcript_56477/g.134126  ORF Transcript_56477/g.134126 Transcript_56477/m.134126 type:complete len:333 (-) Transcript_56477:69-1067(-)
MAWVVCHDAGSEDATVAWSAVAGAKYNLELKEGDGDFASVSDKLLGTLVRKKNLKPATPYTARVRSRLQDESSDWSNWSPEVNFSTLPNGQTRMDAPKLLTHDRESVTISWTPVVGATGYACAWRGEADSAWTDVKATLAGPAMRKKNLAPGTSYYFRVRPCLPEGAAEDAFSPPSAPLTIAPPLSSYMAGIVGGEGASLVTASGETPTAAALGGKVIAIYASASWCGPCKQFTPRLVQFYNEMKAAGKPFEVLFLSCDRDDRAFKGYLAHMPWPAVPFDSDSREKALGTIKVEGIPRLQIVGQNGKVLVDNAVQTPLTPHTLDQWIAAGSV